MSGAPRQHQALENPEKGALNHRETQKAHQEKRWKVYILIIISLIMFNVWNILFRLSESDPEIDQKYTIAAKKLRLIKRAVIMYNCKNGKFPLSLNDLVPETIMYLPRDPWGNKYILISLDWRLKGSGIDILSMGGDGKVGGKGWQSDIIARVDLTEISCEGKNVNMNSKLSE